MKIIIKSGKYKVFNINRKKTKFWFEFGWFKGEDFTLFHLILCDKHSLGFDFIRIKLIKFLIGFGFYEVEE